MYTSRLSGPFVVISFLIAACFFDFKGVSAESPIALHMAKTEKQNSAALADRVYNDKNWLVGITNAEGGVVEYEHDERGNAVLRREKKSDGNWAVWRREFSSQNLLLAELGPEGEETRYVRDDRGLSRYVLTKMDNKRWTAKYYEYDESARITFESIAYFTDSPLNPEADKPADGSRYDYDASGNRKFRSAWQ